jgi:hypothetical protein
VGRAWVGLWIGGLFALFSVGCATTRTSAAQTLVPVLVGPVACIGCPVAPPNPAGGPPIADNTNHWGGVLLIPFVGDSDLHLGKPPQIDGKIAAIVPDPCTGEVRITRLAAKSIGVGAVLVWSAEEKIEVQGVAVPVAPGACGSAPAGWPAPATVGAP